MPISNPRLTVQTFNYQNLGGKQIKEVKSPLLNPQQLEAMVAPLGKTFVVFNVDTSHPARVCLYRSEAYRQADRFRPIGIAATGESGLLLEVVTTANNLNLDLSPLVWGASSEASKNIALNLTNLHSAAVEVVVRFQFIEAEI